MVKHLKIKTLNLAIEANPPLGSPQRDPRQDPTPGMASPYNPSDKTVRKHKNKIIAKIDRS